MTQIPAKALNVDRLGNQYLVTVQVGHAKYAGTFDRLYFGENKPHLGSYRHGWLDLVYHQNQDLKAGAVIPVVDDLVKRASFPPKHGNQKPACATSVMAHAGASGVNRSGLFTWPFPRIHSGRTPPKGERLQVSDAPQER